MHSSMNKTSLAGALLMLPCLGLLAANDFRALPTPEKRFHAASDAFDDPLVGCLNDALGQGVLARVDEGQKRFFLVRQKVSAASLKPVLRKIEICLPPEWAGQWSLSVFSRKELAGYKDEPGIVPFHKHNEWAKGYLAEYDGESGRLTLSPASKPKTVLIK